LVRDTYDKLRRRKADKADMMIAQEAMAKFTIEKVS
jgi:hypothetical protein